MKKLVLLVLVLVAACGSKPATSASPAATDGGPAVADNFAELTMGPFAVPAGGEVYQCQTFANPFGGHDTEVSAFESHMSPGSHHLLVFYRPGGSPQPMSTCSGL